MSTKTSRPTLVAHLLLAGLLCAVPHEARADSGFVLICSVKNASAKVPGTALRDLVTGRAKKWSSGPILQLVLSGEESDELKWLAATYFSISAHLLHQKIRQEVFKGELRAPLPSSGESDTIAKVKANEGALGVVKEGTVLPPGVALLTVEE